MVKKILVVRHDPKSNQTRRILLSETMVQAAAITEGAPMKETGLAEKSFTLICEPHFQKLK